MGVSTAGYLRNFNQRRIIELMLRLRRASRAELARASGISSPTVSRIVDDLLVREILMQPTRNLSADAMVALTDEGNAAVASVGRPSAPLEFDNRTQRFLAIQLGVRQTRASRAPIALPEADAWEASFPTPPDAREWQKQLRRQIAPIEVADLQAVVVSVPGVVDEPSGKALLSPNLKWLESVSLEQIVRPVVAPGTKIIFVQEIRALAFGHLAAAPQDQDFFLIDVGTGVGGAAIVNGSLFSGPLPLSGELGHIPVLGNSRVCGCGSVGCVETLFSRRGLLMSASEHNSITSWPHLVQSVHDNGIPPWMKRSLDAAAVSIAAALNVLGLRKVVLTGCIGELAPSVTDYLSEAIRADAMWARFGLVEVQTAPRRRMAGMIHRAICQTLMSQDDSSSMGKLGL